MVKVFLGSVSHGTMRPEDLIPTFMDVLDDIRERIAAPGSVSEHPEALAQRVQTVSRLDDLLGAMEQRQQADDYYETESADWDLEELFTVLAEFAPPYCHFGAHEGDGADYGFWPSLDSLRDDTDNEFGPVYSVESGTAWESAGLPEGVEYVCEVTDHGNVALYSRSGELLWDCV